MANKGLAGGGFRKCGNDWSYGRFLGSVARKGVSGAFEEGRGLVAGGEKDGGAVGHSKRAQWIDPVPPKKIVYHKVRFVKTLISRLNCYG